MIRPLTLRTTLGALGLLTSVLVGCGGGGSSSLPSIGAPVPTSTPTGSPSPTPTPTSGPTTPGATPTPTAPPAGTLSVNPSTVAFLTTGATNAQNVFVQETGYSGSFAESDTCSSVATIVSTNPKGPAATFTVTASAAGTCDVTFTDATRQQKTIALSVTLSGFGIQVGQHAASSLGVP